MDNEAKPHADTELDPESLDEPPTSNQYYLYSRVDGEQTVDELCRTSGLGRQATLDALEALHRLGLIVVPGYETPADDQQEGAEDDSLNETTAPLDEESEEASDSDGEAAAASEQPAVSVNEQAASADDDGPTQAAAKQGSTQQQEDQQDETRESRSDSEPSSSAAGADFSRLPKSPDEIEIDEELLEMDVDLDVDFRRELVALSTQLEQVNYYEFYGIPADADAGEIKKAYFHLSKRYHPDKHFGGELGPFEEMLEEVFQHITRAYRILTNEERRAEYDADLRGDAEQLGARSSSTAAEAADDEESQSRGKSGEGDQADKQKQQAASRLLVNRARKYRNRGEIDEAADEYRKAVSLNRRLETALEAAEMLVDADHRLDDAAVFARAALKLDESHSDGYYLLGRSYEGREMMDEARKAYEHAVESGGHDDASERLGRLESEGESS